MPIRGRCGNAEDIKKTQKDRKVNAPRRLPRQRPRALTCPLPTKPSRLWSVLKIPHRQKTCEQIQSPLFAHLPYEIRLRIWSEVLGGHLLHIARARKRLLGIKCEEPLDSEHMTRWHGCWGSTTWWISDHLTPAYYIQPKDYHPARPANLLPLLQTCRLIYTETVSIIYSDNIFDINHLDTLLFLRRSVLPRRLKEIRAVNLIWDFKYGSRDTDAPYDPGTWLDICKILASLTGLRKLTMHLTGWGLDMRSRDKDDWETYLEPLKHIKAPQKFYVFVAWTEEQCAEVSREYEYPFTLLPSAQEPTLLYQPDPHNKDMS